MTKYKFIILIFVFFSCGVNKSEKNLTKNDIDYIEQLGILNDNEKIILFESNAGAFGGLKKSGNFITNKRIASYWIDGRNDEINSAEYTEIDSIKSFDKTKATTYSSYLEVYYSSNKTFKVYVDADSTRTWQFLNLGISNWKKHKLK